MCLTGGFFRREAHPARRSYTTAPNAGGFFLGDYAGLTSSGTTFKALFAMSKPIATGGQSDLFSNSVG